MVKEPICPGCKHKLTNKTDVNLEGVSGGVSEGLKSFYIVYCEHCGYPIGTFQK
jgi:predicted nucleic-acid-binding Zn-ribbon protein